MLHVYNTMLCVLVAQSCPILCDPMDCSPPGFSIRGIFQARTLEWVALPSSRGSSRPRDRNRISYISCTGRRILYRCTTCLGISSGEAGVLIFFVFPMVLCINDYIQHRVLPAIVLPLRSPFPGWARALEPFLAPLSPRS